MAIRRIKYTGELDVELLTPGNEYAVVAGDDNGVWVTGDNGCNAFAYNGDFDVLEEDDKDYEFYTADPDEDDE